MDKAAATQAHEFAHIRVYDALKSAIMSGRFIPGHGLTLRGIAEDLGVSPMPVREAIRRLAAERALEVASNRRVYVPTMTPPKFEELVTARCLLETEAAARAMPYVNAHGVQALRRIDRRIDAAIASGDAQAYVVNNHAFHFAIYKAAPSSVLVPLIEVLWLQFSPFMRMVYGRLGTASLSDQHVATLKALTAQDEAALRTAIKADILDGMTLIGKALHETGEKTTARAG